MKRWEVCLHFIDFRSVTKTRHYTSQDMHDAYIVKKKKKVLEQIQTYIPFGEFCLLQTMSTVQFIDSTAGSHYGFMNFISDFK